jgi:hypothetical protein
MNHKTSLVTEFPDSSPPKTNLNLQPSSDPCRTTASRYPPQSDSKQITLVSAHSKALQAVRAENFIAINSMHTI